MAFPEGPQHMSQTIRDLVRSWWCALAGLGRRNSWSELLILPLWCQVPKLSNTEFGNTCKGKGDIQIRQEQNHERTKVWPSFCKYYKH